MLQINDIQVGKSYACKFKVETFLDENHKPTPNLDNKASIGIKEYKSLGILLMRDLDNCLVKLVDQPTNIQFIVPFEDIWDIDEIEWVDPLCDSN